NELGADILVAEIKQPIVVDEDTVEFQMASIRSRKKPTRNILDNLIIEVKETLDGGLVSINNISETIGVEVEYDYRSYGSITLNLMIQLSETLDGGLVSINTLYEVLNTYVSVEVDNRTVTETPTVGTPYCVIDGGTNSYRVLISNNDNMSVTIRNGSTVLGTMTALETNKEFIFASGSSTPYNYNINITAQASGLQQSTNV